MTTTLNNSQNKKKSGFISKPLLVQSIKANWLFWLVLTIGASAIFVIVNIVINSKSIFTNIDMTKVSQYVHDVWGNDFFAWTKILGLLETMGFNLSRIQVMSQIDMNAVLNDLIYKLTGIMLPMIYIMVIANKLIAAQVTDGSMAYILSTPTGRKKVIRTQFIFLIGSLFVMYLIILGAALGSEQISNAIKLAKSPNATIMPPLRTILYMFGSFLSIFALGGICFGASCWFNKSSKSLSTGGGICIICFISCVLGLFGNKVFVAVGLGVESMNIFNYFSVFTLFDTDSISNFVKNVSGDLLTPISFDWIWKFGILFGIGALFSLVGSIKFLKKDLPL